MAFTSQSHPVHRHREFNFRRMHHPAFLVILLSFIILTGLVTSAGNWAIAARSSQAGVDRYTWTVQDVDAPMLFNYMSDRNLRLDAADHPHIAYGGDHLYYAYHDGSAWHYETVDASPGVGLFASLALDGSARPHISYYDSLFGALKYAYFDGASWVITTIDQYALSDEDAISAQDASLGVSNRYVGDRPWRSIPSGLPGDGSDPDAIQPIADLTGYGLYNSIAIDASGNVHISYYDSAGTNLKYARQISGTWSIQTIDFNGDVGQYSSLAVNTSGQAHISYYDATNGNLKFASYNGFSWVVQTLESTGDVGLFTSIALGQNQRPAISYYENINNTDGELHYVYFNGTSWSAPVTIDPEIKTGKYTSLAMTSDFQPRISYYNEDDRNVRYASFSNGVWLVRDVNVYGSMGQHTSLALDSTNRPRISYYSAGASELYYAYSSDGTTWVNEKLEHGGAEVGDVGFYSSLALNAAGLPRIAYFDDTRDDLRYAWWDGSTWQYQVVDQVGDVGLHPSLALDSNGNPHISYYDIKNEHLKYAYWNGASWVATTIDGAIKAGLYSSIDLDVGNVPHIAYYDQQNKNLKYVIGSGGTPVAIDDGSDDSGLYPSLKLDAVGNRHIAYYNVTKTALMYYNWDGTPEILTLDIPNAGLYPSLALDSSNHPHIAYLSDAGDDLKYTRFNGTNWQSELVDTVGYTGWFPSIAVDGAGHPHIAYYSLSQTSLRYAYGTGSGWRLGLIDPLGDTGWNPSIAVAAGDLPVVSYYSATLGDLKFATSAAVSNVTFLPFIRR